MWEVIVILAIILLFAAQPLLRKLPAGVNSSLLLASGVVLVLLVVLAPGSDTWHRFALMAVGALFIARAVRGYLSARTPTEPA